MLGGPCVQNGFQPHHALKGLLYQSVEPVVTSAARLLRNGCGWSLEACIGLDFLRLGLERKHYFEEGDHNHTGLFHHLKAFLGETGALLLTSKARW